MQKKYNLLELQEHAVHFADALRPGDVIALYGPMGVGKTTWVRSLIQHLSPMPITVASPSFTLVYSYPLPYFTLWHFDLYRLKQAEEIFELGWQDALIDGVVIIEWPEICEEYLPKHHIKIKLSMGTHDTRHIEIMRKAYDSDNCDI